MRFPLILGLALAGLAVTIRPAAGQDVGYPREHLYDTTRYPDEALSNVVVALHRWPDCTTLESAVRDIFRLEGVTDKADQDKAFALWKWFRILVSATGGSYAYEIEAPRRPVTDPHKIFTVYGHHQCDGMSWALVSLWRAAGYMALDQCHWGHTVASLYYKDHDENDRFHDFDPQGRFYWWDPKNRWVGTWTNPILRVKVHRHVMQPQHIHSLRTSLRPGEIIERKWDNAGHIVPSGRDKPRAFEDRYYRTPPARGKTIHAAVGEEVQTLDARTDNLFTGSRNTASTGRLLHPARAGRTAVFVYRMGPPYVVADARIEATLVKARPGDVCRLSVSLDGAHWRPVFEKNTVGREPVVLDIGLGAWKKKRPHVYTAYTFYVKAELNTGGDARGVGIEGMKITAVRMLNKRTLPHLRPGGNIVRVTADRIAKGQLLELDVRYRVNGKTYRRLRLIDRFPHYFRIRVPNVPERVLRNYDRHWNDGPLRMISIRLALVPAGEARRPDSSLPAEEAERAFRLASPHPADMTRRRIVQKPETDVRQTNGFFPQAGPGTLDDDAKMQELIRQLNRGRPARRTKLAAPQWIAAEALGDYPKAVDALLDALPRANIDLTLFICKALARNPRKKMIGPLLKKWRGAPKGSPGTRYIPDVLAAIGDRSVVPALVRPLKQCRFDYRFHIARSLGLLGGPEAKQALDDLARNDPFPAVREEAKRSLRRLAEAGTRRR